jgi:hypothetical protein
VIGLTRCSSRANPTRIAHAVGIVQAGVGISGADVHSVAYPAIPGAATGWVRGLLSV